MHGEDATTEPTGTTTEPHEDHSAKHAGTSIGPADLTGRKSSRFLKFLGIGLLLGLPTTGLIILLNLDTESGTGLIPCQGNIRYYENPVTGGYVQTKWLEGTKNATGSRGKLDKKGRFTLYTDGLPGAPIGEHRIAVMVFSDDEERRPLIPEHYTSVDTTPLTINVQPHRTGQPNVFTLFISNDPPRISPQTQSAAP